MRAASTKTVDRTVELKKHRWRDSALFEAITVLAIALAFLLIVGALPKFLHLYGNHPNYMSVWNCGS